VPPSLALSFTFPGAFYCLRVCSWSALWKRLFLFVRYDARKRREEERKRREEERKRREEEMKRREEERRGVRASHSSLRSILMFEGVRGERRK
jgi:hypothetical protein